MKLNNNAFTLVELLGVIVILAMLSLISGVAITNVVKNSKNTLNDSQIETLKYSAQLWVENNLDKIDIPGCTYISKEALKENGIISDIKEIRRIVMQYLEENWIRNFQRRKNHEQARTG